MKRNRILALSVVLLLALQLLLEEERRALPFDWQLDFAFCTETEAAGSPFYARFLQVWQQDFVYELLRLSSELLR